MLRAHVFILIILFTQFQHFVDGLIVYFNVCWLDAPRCPFFPRTVWSFETGNPPCRKRMKQIHCSGSVPFGSQVDVLIRNHKNISNLWFDNAEEIETGKKIFIATFSEW